MRLVHNARLPARWWHSLSQLFGRRRWWTTLLVLAASAGMVRLGFWQLDRLEERRTRNAELARQLALPPLRLGVDPLPDDLALIGYRRATASGRFDFSRQVALKVQNWEGSAGIHLVAPLVFEGTARAVLVDRGWIPDQLAAPEQWAQFDETGPVSGYLRRSQTAARASGSPTPASGPVREWYRVDIAALQAQMPYELLPVYLVQSPGSGGNQALPYRADPEFDLSEGAHLSYALQWGTFAVILLVVYVSYVVKHPGFREGAGSESPARRSNGQS